MSLFLQGGSSACRHSARLRRGCRTANGHVAAGTKPISISPRCRLACRGLPEERVQQHGQARDEKNEPEHSTGEISRASTHRLTTGRSFDHCRNPDQPKESRKAGEAEEMPRAGKRQEAKKPGKRQPSRRRDSALACSSLMPGISANAYTVCAIFSSKPMTAMCSASMSTCQPVSLAVSRAFWPRLPMARDN